MLDWIKQTWRSQAPNLGIVATSADESLVVIRRSAPSDEELADAVLRYQLRTVLDLRVENARTQEEFQAIVRSPSVRLIRAGLWDKPKVVDVARVEQCAALLANEANWPLLVHCEGGRHRTGAVVATYRVRYGLYDPKHAYEDARRYGLYGDFGHEAWVRYILSL